MDAHFIYTITNWLYVCEIARLACLMGTTIFALALRSCKPGSPVLKAWLRLIVFMGLLASDRRLARNARCVVGGFLTSSIYALAISDTCDPAARETSVKKTQQTVLSE